MQKEGRKLISGGSGIWKLGLHYKEMGPAWPLGRWPFVRERNFTAKRASARVVLGWVTSWEVLMLHLFFGNSFFARSSGRSRARRTLIREAHLRRIRHSKGGAPLRGDGPRKASRAAAPSPADACL
ncbi:hypothetical protein PIB30_038174 [Stylosanthes scabra]|uniref:Uncharacterized protein n=1 Tax=Stylosanthes scabra TaxID=79078 RepID=A0ABU6YFX2_9FABA|nr:hypothetical protein [Stylosanthes scabra]